jgi:hypothetical protein
MTSHRGARLELSTANYPDSPSGLRTTSATRRVSQAITGRKVFGYTKRMNEYIIAPRAAGYAAEGACAEITIKTATTSSPALSRR